MNTISILKYMHVFFKSNVINREKNKKNDFTWEAIIIVGQAVFHPILFAFANRQSQAPGKLLIHQKSKSLTTLYAKCSYSLAPHVVFFLVCVCSLTHNPNTQSAAKLFLPCYHSPSSQLWKRRRQAGLTECVCKIALFS